MITYLDLISPVRDIGGAGKKTGFTAGEGYAIEPIEDGAAFKLSHPDKGQKAYPRRIPITNVASWGDSEDEPKRPRAPAHAAAAAANGASGEMTSEDGIAVRRVSEGTVHFGRAPEPEAAPPTKKGKRG